MGISSLRQLSTMLKMAAIFGPASSLPRCRQFLRLCEDLHKRNYVQFPIMRSVLGC